MKKYQNPMLDEEFIAIFHCVLIMPKKASTYNRIFFRKDKD